MNKVKALRITNILLGISFIMVALPGVIQGLFKGLIDYSVFRVVHPIAGYAFIALVGVHVALNFTWIKANYLKKKTK
jgi:hypothetical protein